MLQRPNRSPPSVSRRAIMIGAAIVAAVMAGTLALWVYYGSAVFYEMILAGVGYCF
jgi:hypothetical protein